MKVSHVLYKVNNLKDAIVKFRDMGFKVEYGSKHKPHNALIYFSKGPYIELLNRAPISLYLKVLLRVIGKGKVVDRFELWEKEDEGFFGLCLESHETNFNKEESILKKHKQDYFITYSKRTDPSDRTLTWKLLFPYEVRLPFFMTYFNLDPKPKGFTHPNGIKKIDSISLGTDAKLFPIINELCDDKTLELFVGKGLKVIYDKQEL